MSTDHETRRPARIQCPTWGCRADRSHEGDCNPSDFADMYERAYFGVQEVLDGALGSEWQDGSGGGIVADVDLLARRYKRAIAALDAVEQLTKDTDGGDIDADADIPVGEIRRVLAEAGAQLAEEAS